MRFLKAIIKILTAPIVLPIVLLRNWCEWLFFMGVSRPKTAFKKSPTPPSPEKELQQVTSTTTYVMSSLFLHKSFRYLTRNPTEDLHLVTGIKIDGRFVLNEMLRLPHVERSVAGAFSEAHHVRKGLSVMQSFGMRCGGLFHSHPGSGRNSSSPSSTDWATQRVWEQAYPLIGGVFSRDGYVRFFASSNHWKVEVQGKKVRRIDEQLYKLELD